MLAYAAGGLDEGLSVVVATHLSACLACRDAVRVCEAVGGQMMAALEAAPMAPDALSRAVNAAIDSGKPTLINAIIDEKAGTESGRIGNLNPQSVVGKK